LAKAQKQENHDVFQERTGKDLAEARVKGEGARRSRWILEGNQKPVLMTRLKKLT
jgi:hypothetical protein